MKSLIYKERKEGKYYCSIVNELDKMKITLYQKICIVNDNDYDFSLGFEIKERKEDYLSINLKKEVKVSLF